MRAAIKSKVDRSLADLAQRQIMRDAARRSVNQTNAVYVARRAGALDSLEECTDWLTAAGIVWTSEEYYGCTLVYTCSVVLGFGPDGKLQWSSRQKTTAIWQEQFDFNGGSSGGTSSEASSSACLL